MGNFYLVVAIVGILSFIVSLMAISPRVKWGSRGLMAAAILAAIIFEAVQ